MAMPGLVSCDGPFWLTQGVAQTLGVNLTDAMASGVLDRRRYLEMVQRCEACACRRFCTSWMGSQDGRATAAPEYCGNRDAFARVRERMT